MMGSNQVFTEGRRNTGSVQGTFISVVKEYAVSSNPTQFP